MSLIRLAANGRRIDCTRRERWDEKEREVKNSEIGLNIYISIFIYVSKRLGEEIDCTRSRNCRDCRKSTEEAD